MKNESTRFGSLQDLGANRHALRPENLAMVGDRLYTDIAMARRAGALGVLVLTGETTAAQAASSWFVGAGERRPLTR